MPRKNRIDATDLQIGQPGVVTMPLAGVATLERPDIQPVDGPQFKSLAEELAFMEEPVTVVVMGSSDKNAEPVVEVGVNGVPQRFIRDVPITVKRKYVERLARSKPVAFRNEEFTDGDGNKSVRWPTSAGLRYPFQVQEDKNPRGMAWLRKVLAEA